MITSTTLRYFDGNKMDQHQQELEHFITVWPESSSTCRARFIYLKAYLQELDGVTLQFIPRPGVTYSLRASHRGQNDRPLFTMVDVIDAEPRWLSVCFYGETVSDPEERGDLVPGGLLGEDGLCFDVENGSDDFFEYVIARIDEAYQSVIIV
jgi:hypothetical protein